MAIFRITHKTAMLVTRLLGGALLEYRSAILAYAALRFLEVLN